MSRHDDSVILRQMLDHAREAVTMVRGHPRSAIDSNRMLSLALLQLAQIVGEAASRVSEPTRERHPEIPWRQVISFRNRLIHGYDTIDFDILWRVLTVDLPALITTLEKIATPKDA